MGEKDMKREVGDSLRCPAPAPRLSPLSLSPLSFSAPSEHSSELHPRRAQFRGGLICYAGATEPCGLDSIRNSDLVGERMLITSAQEVHDEILGTTLLLGSDSFHAPTIAHI